MSKEPDPNNPVCLFVYDMYSRGDPPSTPELKIMFSIATEALLRYEAFVKATKEGKRVVKRKTLTLYLDKSKLKKRDFMMLDTITSIPFNDYYITKNVVLVWLRCERGLGINTLHHLLLIRDLISDNFAGGRGLEDLYRRAGIMAEMDFQVIDDEVFLEIITDVLNTAKSWRNVKASAFYDIYNGHVDYVTIRAMRKSMYEKLKDTKLHLPLLIGIYEEVWTVQDLMEFKDYLNDEMKKKLRKEEIAKGKIVKYYCVH